MECKQTIRPAPWCPTSPSTGQSYALKGIGILILILGAVPNAASAQDAMINEKVGEISGERGVTLSGNGSSDRNVDAGSFGTSGDLGWHLSKQSVGGVQQGLSYSGVKGDRHKDELWSGATKGYVDSRLGDSAVFPDVDLVLGGIRGDGISDAGFAGVDVRRKYFGLSSTFHIGRAEYQWFFRKLHSANNHIDHGPRGYAVGLGYNF